MKKIIFPLTLLLLSFTIIQQNTFEQLFPLAGGTWIMKTKSGTIIGERWTKQDNTLLTSQGFRIKGKDTTLDEHVELSVEGKDIYYTSIVPNQNQGKAVPFKLIEAKNNRFVFSNPKHDFPQRIIYEFISADSLHASIEGTDNGVKSSQNFYYKRVQ